MNNRISSEILGHFIKKLYMMGLSNKTLITGVELSKYTKGANWLYLFSIEFEANGEYYDTQFDTIMPENIMTALFDQAFANKIHANIKEVETAGTIITTRKISTQVDVKRRNYTKSDFPKQDAGVKMMNKMLKQVRT